MLLVWRPRWDYCGRLVYTKVRGNVAQSRSQTGRLQQHLELIGAPGSPWDHRTGSN